MNFLKSLILGLISTFVLLPASYGNSCIFSKPQFNEKLRQTYRQNPITLVETFTQASHRLIASDIQDRQNVQNQNNIMKLAFDLNLISSAASKNFNSSSVFRPLMDWVRTQYWGNVQKLYFNKEKKIKLFAPDLLAPGEVAVVDEFPVLGKVYSFKSRNCLRSERKVHLCDDNKIYEAKVQFSPLLSCRNSNITENFRGVYYLSFSKQHGFKIVDVSLSGKRILLSSLNHLLTLRKNRYNKDGILAQLQILSSSYGSFLNPPRVPHSNGLLSRYRSYSPRIPASL